MKKQEQLGDGAFVRLISCANLEQFKPRCLCARAEEKAEAPRTRATEVLRTVPRQLNSLVNFGWSVLDGRVTNVVDWSCSDEKHQTASLSVTGCLLSDPIWSRLRNASASFSTPLNFRSTGRAIRVE